MKFEKIHNKGQAQLFQNPALEFLTKTHPLGLVLMFAYLKKEKRNEPLPTKK